MQQGEVTVLVRSMLLRGFDRDMVDKIQKHMLALGSKKKAHLVPPWFPCPVSGPYISLAIPYVTIPYAAILSLNPPLPRYITTGTKILIGRLPARIEKVTQGDGDISKLRVVYDNGESELFDTVIAAVGRYD